jgi:tripartite-type tricarboxylate transporter receptor subunit TctC
MDRRSTTAALFLAPFASRVALAPLACLALGAVASEPVRPLRLLVPYPAGGIVDGTARHLAAPLQRALQQELLVENLPGAGGALAYQRLLAGAASHPGQEVVLGTDSDAILVPLVNADARYRPADLRVIGLVSSSPMVLVAGARQAAADAAALAAQLRGGGPPARFGSYGIGSNAHLCAEDFAQRLGVALVHVPYKGIAPLLQDLLGGHVDLAFVPLAGPMVETLASGKLRPLLVAGAERHPRLPAVPTAAQALQLQGFSFSSWSALMLPAQAPEAVVQRLHRALADGLRDAGFRQSMEAAGSGVSPPATLAEAAQVFDEQAQRYRGLLAQLRARGVELGR